MKLVYQNLYNRTSFPESWANSIRVLMWQYHYGQTYLQETNKYIPLFPTIFPYLGGNNYLGKPKD